MGRTAQMVLGIVGGIFGIIGAFVGMLLVSTVGAIGSSLQNLSGNVSGAVQTQATVSSTVGMVWIAVLAGIIGIIGAVWVKSHPKRAGWMMIIGAVGGLIFSGLFFILGTILLGIGGIMALMQKEEAPKLTTK